MEPPGDRRGSWVYRVDPGCVNALARDGFLAPDDHPNRVHAPRHPATTRGRRIARAGIGMTAGGVNPDEPARRAGRAWNVALLSPTEPGRRNRRTVDAAFLVLGAIVAGLTAV